MKKYLIPVFVLGNIYISAQNNTLKEGFINNIKSPQVTDFIRYGNIPIKKNVGELDLNIPLLSIPTQDGNNIDISLAYNASGFIPSKKSGIVGFNWSLMAGGVITREVRGEADDQLGSPQTLNGINGHHEHGYLAGIRQFGSNTNLLPTDNDLNNFSSTKMTPALDNASDDFYELRLKGYPDDNTTRYETTPDMFSFNFNGIYGKFFIAPNGNVEVTTSDPHKLSVDLSGVNSQPYIGYCTPRYESEIKITDELGNKYYFGKQGKNLEYSVFLGPDANGDNSNSTPVINSWYLYKMEFTNGETINYNYLEDNLPINSSGSGFCHTSPLMFWKPLTQYAETKKLLDFNVHANDYRRIVSTDQQGWGMEYTHYTAEYATGYGNVYSIIKKALLSSIIYKGTKINFVYSDQNNLYKNIDVFGSGGSTTPMAKPNQKKLDKIEVYSQNNLVNDISFTYDVYNTQYPRIFLKKIQERGKSPFIFSYDSTNAANTPIPHTCALDYWGYYNGKLTNDPYFSTPKLIPGVTYYNNGDFQYTSDERDPNFDYAKMYALTGVTYPTGGKSFFEYEPHQYSQRLERRFDNLFIPKLYSIIGISGGTRIKKVYDFDSNTNQNIREFFYSNDSNQSSGILMDWPRYYFKIRKQINNSQIYPIAIDETVGYQVSSGFSKNLFESSVINYSQVTEKLTNKGSITDYYTSYIDRPDRYINYNNFTIKLTDGTYTPSPSVSNIFIMPDDTNIERGKLSKKLIRDENNNLLEETNIVYNEDPNRYDKFHLSINISNAWAQKLKTYYYNNFVSKSTTKKYFGGNIVTTENNFFYDYNLHNMLVKSTVKQPDNTIEESIFKYSPELGNLYLKDKNIVGIPLENKLIKKNDSGDQGKVVSFTQQIYPANQTEANTKTSGLPLPYSVLSTDLQNITKEEVAYDKYDLKGNLQQYTTKNGVSTTIIWGYNQTQPIARIEGAKLLDIQQSLIDAIVTASNIDASATANNDETPLLNALKTFRDNLPAYQITTYTYDPLVGVRTITSPSGIRENYIYDSANRLEKVTDMDGKILKEIKYNYKN
ncbi:hypothetical protein LF887_10745 [Chryseobacterium sp. MEBOG06]|uniref:hypothetical protein n=1 Tax=Chryseobacterium sp. MEBOG06 TaxID=2879938 RepID=UPI001F37BB98|nr:hypothetical protein [Chryseobacterium sp. MEBOG06]UKB86075.1 hypothetical protein LF887_10745 [Chryseobacterium sp. MEBOG06]